RAVADHEHAAAAAEAVEALDRLCAAHDCVVVTEEGPLEPDEVSLEPVEVSLEPVEVSVEPELDSPDSSLEPEEPAVFPVESVFVLVCAAAVRFVRASAETRAGSCPEASWT
ncbi:MAG: hypothetical protein ACLQBB_00585, partial [Solirubrobacteraceae bacterium]